MRKEAFDAKSFRIWLLLTGILFGQGVVLGWEPVDDAYISFRYARNCSYGHGLVFNVGEPVEGYTNFLWTILLAILATVGLDIPSAAVFLGFSCSALTLWLLRMLGLRVGRERGWSRGVEWIAPTILACYPGWGYWAFSGMEGPLLSLLTLGFVLLTVDPKRRGAIYSGAMVGVLATLTRWEFILLWPVGAAWIFLDLTVPLPRRLLRAGTFLLILVAGFGAYFVWRFNYYGEFMPNTFYAKTGGSFLDRALNGIIYTGELGVGWLLPLTGIIWLWRIRGRASIGMTTILLIWGSYCIWTGGDFFPWLRFFLPILPFCALIAANAIGRLLKARITWLNDNRARFIVTAVVILVIDGIAFRLDYHSATNHVEEVNRWKHVAAFVKKELPDSYRVAVAPIGVIGYYGDHATIDLLGLTDYETAHFGESDAQEAPGHQRSHIRSVLRRRPEVILANGLVLLAKPTEQEAIRQSARRSLKRLLHDPVFRGLYVYQVEKAEGFYMPFWMRKDLVALKH